MSPARPHRRRGLGPGRGRPPRAGAGHGAPLVPRRAPHGTRARGCARKPRGGVAAGARTSAAETIGAAIFDPQEAPGPLWGAPGAPDGPRGGFRRLSHELSRGSPACLRRRFPDFKRQSVRQCASVCPRFIEALEETGDDDVNARIQSWNLPPKYPTDDIIVANAW